MPRCVGLWLLDFDLRVGKIGSRVGERCEYTHERVKVTVKDSLFVDVHSCIELSLCRSLRIWCIEHTTKWNHVKQKCGNEPEMTSYTNMLSKYHELQVKFAKSVAWTSNNYQHILLQSANKPHDPMNRLDTERCNWMLHWVPWHSLHGGSGTWDSKHVPKHLNPKPESLVQCHWEKSTTRTKLWAEDSGIWNAADENLSINKLDGNITFTLYQGIYRPCTNLLFQGCTIYLTPK